MLNFDRHFGLGLFAPAPDVPEERAMDWYYYLEEKLAFPFIREVRCGAIGFAAEDRRGGRGTRGGEGRRLHARDALIRVAGHKLGVPLSPVEAVEGTSEVHEAVEDWYY